MKIAVVFGYSSSCSAMAKQLIISCYKCFLKSNKKHSLSFFAYQHNWIYRTLKCNPNDDRIQLRKELDIPVDIFDIDASKIEMKAYLPDIVIYDHFSRQKLQDYNYVLFCHDDIIFSECNFFDYCVDILDSVEFDIIAEPHIECSAMISARFYPGFIFVKSDKFIDKNLSFIHDDLIFDKNLYFRKIWVDGGSGLLASYYRNKNTTSRPYTKIPKFWFTHLKLGEENGVESYNLSNHGSEDFKKLMISCEKYVDSFLWNKE